jgi:hypothetical protein
VDSHAVTCGNLRAVDDVPMLSTTSPTSTSQKAAVLEPVRFGEYLRERNLITDEQLLAALAEHWSDRRFTIGQTLVEQGILPLELVEAEASAYHHDLDVVELDVVTRTNVSLQ